MFNSFGHHFGSKEREHLIYLIKAQSFFALLKFAYKA